MTTFHVNKLLNLLTVIRIQNSQSINTHRDWMDWYYRRLETAIISELLIDVIEGWPVFDLYLTTWKSSTWFCPLEINIAKFFGFPFLVFYPGLRKRYLQRSCFRFWSLSHPRNPFTFPRKIVYQIEDNNNNNNKLITGTTATTTTKDKHESKWRRI